MSEDKVVFFGFEKDKLDRKKNGESFRVVAMNIWGEDASYDTHWYPDEIEKARKIGLIKEDENE